MARSPIKKLWDACPPFLRGWLCAGVAAYCGARRERGETPLRTGPYYVCGAFRNAGGIAQGARLYADELEERGEKVYRIDLTRQMRMPPNLPFGAALLGPTGLAAAQDGGTAVIHANPPQFYSVLAALGRDFLRKRHVTAYWAWEKESLPPYWLPAFKYADSFEAPSSFVVGILGRHTEKPVSLHPHHAPRPAAQKKFYASGGKPRCLFIFDAGASYERKNPSAVLEAFKKAFRPGEAELTFKVSDPFAYPARFEAFSAACAQTPGVEIIAGVLEPHELERLYLEHDVYVSLHGSEGYGLTIREALDRGLYAVVSAYGASAEFADDEKFRSRLRLVKASGFKNGYAVPDIDEAARELRKIGDLLSSKKDA